MAEEFKERCAICGGAHPTGACFSVEESKPKTHTKPGKEAKEIWEKDPVEVSGEFLVGVYNNQDFKKHLLSASAKAKKAQDEFGFEILRHIYTNDLRFGKVVGSSFADRTDLGESTKSMEHSKIGWTGKAAYHPFSSLHFHPPGENIIIPSTEPGDLEVSYLRTYHFGEMSGWAMPHIQMTALNTKSGMNILAYREPLDYHPRNLKGTFKQMEEELWDAGDQEDVVRALRGGGYIADMLKADNTGQFDLESLERLKVLSYKPVRYKNGK